MSANIVVLDRLLVHYGSETKEARALLRSSLAAELERFRSAYHGGPASLEPTGSFEIIYDKISPQSEVQRSVQSQALNSRCGRAAADDRRSHWEAKIPIGYRFDAIEIASVTCRAR